MESNFLCRQIAIGQGGMVFKLKEGRYLLDVRAILFIQKMLKHWRSCGCPIPGCTEGQVGWGPGQPDLVGGSPAHDGVGTGRSLKVPSNPRHSMRCCSDCSFSTAVRLPQSDQASPKRKHEGAEELCTEELYKRAKVTGLPAPEIPGKSS